MTWGSSFTRSLGYLLVLPLILTRLGAAEIALWYIFTTIIALQLLADLGFSPTFTRVLSYATGGASKADLKSFLHPRPIGSSSAPNWRTIESICATMRVVYNRLTFLSMGALLTLGTAAVARPISMVNDTADAWAAWIVVLVGSAIALRGNYFSAYLNGLNHVALVRRWEAVTNIGAVLTSFLVLVWGGHLFALVLANQTWMALNILRNRILCRLVSGGRFKHFQLRDVDPTVMDAVWPSAWRSGLGMLAAQGPVRLTGLLFAQVGSAPEVAMYLLALKLLTSIREVARAPFYSKIPLLARLRSQGKLTLQLVQARRGMRFAHWLFVGAFCLVGMLGDEVLRLIGSNAPFADPLLWSLLGIGMFIETYGAMHLHLYSTTNHIIWHVANGVAGILFIVIVAALFAHLQVYAFPCAYIVSYGLFYAPYTARHSYGMINIGAWEFERSVALPPALAIVAYGVVMAGSTMWGMVAHG